MSGKFFVDPGLEYPGATRAELVEAGDWFLASGSEPGAHALRVPAGRCWLTPGQLLYVSVPSQNTLGKRRTRVP